MLRGRRPWRRLGHPCLEGRRIHRPRRHSRASAAPPAPPSIAGVGADMRAAAARWRADSRSSPPP